MEELSQRLAGDHLDDGAENVGGVAVDEGLTRLRVRRQACQAVDGLDDRLFAIGEVPPLDPRLMPERGRGSVAVAEAGGMGQEVAQGDRTVGWHHAVVVADGDRDLVISEGGEEVAQRLPDQELPVLLQHQDRERDQSLGLRGDPKDVVSPHGCAGLAIAVAEGLVIDELAAPRHECDRSGEPIVVDVALEHLRQALEPLRRHAHFFRLCGG